MNILALILQLAAFIPTIVSKVQQEHADKSVETKTQIASDWLGVATQVAASVLPASDQPIAAAAGAGVQGILAATVQAVHTAATPTPTTATTTTGDSAAAGS